MYTDVNSSNKTRVDNKLYVLCKFAFDYDYGKTHFPGSPLATFNFVLYCAVLFDDDE